MQDAVCVAREFFVTCRIHDILVIVHVILDDMLEHMMDWKELTRHIVCKVHLWVWYITVH